MSEDRGVSPSKGRGPSRRTMLRLGLLAIPATQMPIRFVPHAAAQGAKLGANLIGKLEGAEVVTDPALFPKSFKEAPQLAELVKAGKVDAYEVRGREVVLYWRQIKAGVKNNVSLSLTAGVPGTYMAPASRAYEYYTDEFKQWVDGASVTIRAK